MVWETTRPFHVDKREKTVPDPATTHIVPSLALAYQGNLSNTAIAISYTLQKKADWFHENGIEDLTVSPGKRREGFFF